MAQRIKQMNQLEQSRYEAFKQSTFSSTAVSNYIAACLIHSNKRSSRNRLNQIRLLGTSNAESDSDINDGNLGQGDGDEGDGQGDGDDEGEGIVRNDDIVEERRYNQQIVPPSERAAVEANSILSSIHLMADSHDSTATHTHTKLSDLVAPGAASKITAVVTTLAKINAQRLIQSARNIATNDYNYDQNKPLLPQHLMEAHRRQSRNQNGKNNGFFMNLSSSSSLTQRHPSFLSGYCSIGNMDGCSTNGMDRGGSFNKEHISSTSSSEEQNRIKYMAALQAQEEFDKIFLSGEMDQEKEEEDSEDKEDAMEVMEQTKNEN